MNSHVLGVVQLMGIKVQNAFIRKSEQPARPPFKMVCAWYLPRYVLHVHPLILIQRRDASVNMTRALACNNITHMQSAETPCNTDSSKIIPLLLLYSDPHKSTDIDNIKAMLMDFAKHCQSGQCMCSN